MQGLHQQSSRQLQDRLTSLPAADVLTAAARFFARQGGVYTAFVEKQGPTYVVLRGQGGEEIAIATRETPEGTMVSGSSYLFDQQIARFFTSLPPAPVLAAPQLTAGDAVSAEAAE